MTRLPQRALIRHLNGGRPYLHGQPDHNSSLIRRTVIRVVVAGITGQEA